MRGRSPFHSFEACLAATAGQVRGVMSHDFPSREARMQVKTASHKNCTALLLLFRSTQDVADHRQMAYQPDKAGRYTC